MAGTRYPNVTRRGRGRWLITYMVPGLGRELNKRRKSGAWDNRYNESIRAASAREANAIRERRLRDVEEGRWRPRDRRLGLGPDVYRFGEAVARFLELYKPRSQRIGYYRERAAVWLRHFDPAGPVELQIVDVEAFRNDRLRAVSPSTVKKDLTALGTFYKWAIPRGLASSNPADPSAVKRPSEPPPVTEYLDEDQLGTLLGDAAAWLQRFITWAVGTGMDRGEIIALQWGSIDLRPPGVIHAPRSKNNAPREIPLTAGLREIIAECQRVRTINGGDRVFLSDRGRPLTREGVKSALRRLYDRTGVEARQPSKIFRHTFGSRLAMAGRSPHDIAYLLGDTIETAGRYMHLSPAHHRDAMEAIERGDWRMPDEADSQTGGQEE